jgi:hypothetical protein
MAHLNSDWLWNLSLYISYEIGMFAAPFRSIRMKCYRINKGLGGFLLLAIVLCSCSVAKKNKEQRIVGAWNIVNVLDTNPDVTEQWTFDANGTISRTEITDTGITYIDESNWVIEQKINTSYLDIFSDTLNFKQTGYTAIWEILSLKKETMFITQRDGGLLTKEFEKAN